MGRRHFHPRQTSKPRSDKAVPGADPVADIVYGKNPVREILRASSRRIREILVTKDSERSWDPVLRDAVRAAQIPVSVVDPKQLDKLAPDAVHQNVVARVEPYHYAEMGAVLRGVPERATVLILDCVQDPQNFATLCRSALAFGAHAVILPKDRSVAVTATVCKASSGAVEHLKIAQVVNLVRAMEQLKEAGFWIYGTTLAPGTVDLDKCSPAAKSAVVLGSEGDGLRSLVAKTCDVLIKIPMKTDFDSLNVAQAGTVCLYEFAARGA